ncbi:hypothetical protein [Enterobacter kobei]|uniref:hypothetical protein n=1 Tax=Enterobacter kobei TaxID=208224 RepID=UPI003CC82416
MVLWPILKASLSNELSKQDVKARNFFLFSMNNRQTTLALSRSGNTGISQPIIDGAPRVMWITFLLLFASLGEVARWRKPALPVIASSP